MPFEQKPNTGTLWINNRKQAETHPDYKGDLLISRELLQKIAQYGEAKIEISAWIGETKNGKPRISITCKEPYQRDSNSQQNYASEPEPIAPPIYQSQRPIAKLQLTPEQGAAKRLQQIKDRLPAITNYPDFEQIYNWAMSPEIWKQFQVVPAIAQEASQLLSAKKTELVLATPASNPPEFNDIPF